MIFLHDHVRLTLNELNELRRAAARNGFVHNHIHTREQLRQAALDGLSARTQDDLLKYLQETSVAPT